MTDEIRIDALHVGRLLACQEHELGTLLVLEAAGDAVKLGLLFDEAVANEIAGALIERPTSVFGHHGSSPDNERGFVVGDVEILPPKGELFEFRFATGDGPAVTFRLADRQVERLRNILTGQIARRAVASKQ